MKTTSLFANTINTNASRRQSTRRANKLASGIGALTALATLLALAPAQAQFGPPAGTQFVQKYVDFKATNRSMWGPNYPAGFSYSYPLSFSWNTGNQSSSSYSAGSGGEANVNSNGTTGLNLSASANAGSVDVDYNCNILLVPPTDLKPGQTFTIPSYWGFSGSLATHSPQASVSVGASLHANAGVTVKGKVAGSTVFNKGVNVSVNQDVSLLSLDSSHLGGSLDIKGKGILTGEGHIPTINTQGSNWSGTDGSGNVVYPAITASGSDDFLTIDGDITRIITTTMEELGVEVPPLKDDESFSVKKLGINWASGSGGYNLLDLYGEVALTGQQDFAFKATPMITLKFSAKRANGSLMAPLMVSFPVGTTYTGMLPTSFSGPVTVTATVDIASSNTFTNHTNLIVNPGLYFLPVEAYINGKVVGQSFVNKDFKPVGPLDLISHAYPISLFNQSFALGGFTPQDLPGFTINVSN